MPTPRLLSLDLFRGLTIAAMLIVNNPGSWSHSFPPLRHADWHGCTPTDLVFPFFLFAVGIALAFSSRLTSSHSTSTSALPCFQALPAIIRRGLILIALGIGLNFLSIIHLPTPVTSANSIATGWRIDWNALRFPGVLQRIGLVYILAATLILFFRTRGIIAISTTLLLAYWAAMFWLAPKSSLSPPPHPLDPDHNLARSIDLFLIPASHLYRAGSGTDPEGILSTIPALVTTLIGYVCGRTIKQALGTDQPTSSTKQIALWSLLLIPLGWLWANAGPLAFPLNKPLWSSSYVLFTAGWAMLIMAVLLWLVDLRPATPSTAPAAFSTTTRLLSLSFQGFGINAILAFVLSGILGRLLSKLTVNQTPLNRLLHSHLFESWLPPVWASLAWALVWLVLYWVLFEFLRRRSWIWKV
jgi:predicted acyltransferase